MMWCGPAVKSVRSEKLQNESFPNFLIFRPEFCPEFSPNFLRSFRASYCGRRRPEKIHQKSPPFFNAKFPGKFEEKIHKIILESGQSKKVACCSELARSCPIRLPKHEAGSAFFKHRLLLLRLQSREVAC